MKRLNNVMKIVMLGCAVALVYAGSKPQGGGTMLSTGTQAPDFSLVSDKGDTVKFSDYKGKKYVVLVFYPGDQTPGCTHQLCAIRDDFSKFQEKDAVVFGVNPADMESHKKFVEKQHYQFPLLVDPGMKVAALYGTKGFMIQRTVFVIDKEGKIIFAKRGMPSDSEILASIPAKKE
ncbi:MAG TPA: peroxiredoxin [Chitinivibrionales bacterium]|nr:peroxiredoxin [Chitinivibrionales bacterium]